jgi:hypothetical protein
MMFTQRHYEALANRLKAVKPTPKNTEEAWQWEIVVEELCGLFSQDNYRFDPGKFRDACGYPVDPR